MKLTFFSSKYNVVLYASVNIRKYISGVSGPDQLLLPPGQLRFQQQLFTGTAEAKEAVYHQDS